MLESNAVKVLEDEELVVLNNGGLEVDGDENERMLVLEDDEAAAVVIVALEGDVAEGDGELRPRDAATPNRIVRSV